jgi:hypothetical protein
MDESKSHISSLSNFEDAVWVKITGSSRPITLIKKKEEKIYAVYHIECGIMQDISVFKNKEKAEEYYEDLIIANYPEDAEDIIRGKQGQEGDHTIDLLTVEIKE